MGALKLKKATREHIESELYGYKDTLKEIKQLKEHIMFCSDNDDENTGGGRSSFISDPTGRTATRLMTHKRLNQLEDITNAIETVYTKLPEEQKKLVRLKYWTRPQTLTWEGIARELNVGRMTAFRWRDAIIFAIAELIGWR